MQKTFNSLFVGVSLAQEHRYFEVGKISLLAPISEITANYSVTLK